jgi:hypothetical protein
MQWHNSKDKRPEIMHCVYGITNWNEIVICQSTDNSISSDGKYWGDSCWYDPYLEKSTYIKYWAKIPFVELPEDLRADPWPKVEVPKFVENGMNYFGRQVLINDNT